LGKIKNLGQMKRIRVLYILPILLLGVLSFTIYKSGDKEKVLLDVLSKSLTMAHYEKTVLDKNFSNKVYNSYIENIDVRKLYLLKEDIDKLSKFKNKLDEEIKDTNYDFFDLSLEILKGRIKEAEQIYKEIMDKPFDFEKAETVETDPTKLEFPKNAKERYERWYKILKYQTMIKLDDLMSNQENAKKTNDTTVKILGFKELEIKAREKVKGDYQEYFRRTYQLTDNDYLSTYLNSYVGCFDPHTEYMPPQDKEDFDIRMSGQLEGIGAQLYEQNGYVKVSRIIAGSPSWKDGQLKAGDIILKVAQAGAEPVSVVDMRISDAVQLIRGKKGTEVRLTVKKADGAIVNIPLIRDIVILEDTYAKSAILQIDGSGKRYGYINLPGFYANFNDRDGRRSAQDVAIEIEKLKKDDVDGIILDLRNNGGGSLQDAVEMSGLFIKDGPIVQVKSREDEPYILSDRDKRVQYDGNLIVMVNSLSASASEILAAAMQDYQRAVIVGAPSTYGKGTVQRLIELDELISNSYSQLKPFGSLKVTIQKFYRINGGATQLKGVIPDVILPDLYGAIELGEKELSNAMKWDEIAPAQFTKWQIPVTNLPEVKELSKSRVEQSNTFNLISENSKRLKLQSAVTEYSLNLKEYRALQDKLREDGKKFDKMLDHDTRISATSLSEDARAFANDTVKMASAKDWHKELKQDAYLEEAVFIMKDLK
jgi:carboxyl-terminal processing protease